MNRKVIVWTVIAGALGGFAANISVFSEPAVWAAFGTASFFKYVVTPVLLGGLSAGIGVFVLTKTDTSDLVRTFFFASICGLAFPQIIENAKRTVSGESTQEVSAHALKESTQKLQSLLAAAKPDSGSIKEVAGQVRTLSNRVSAPEAKVKAVNALQAAASALPKSDEKVLTIDMIKDVGVAAASKKDWETTLQTYNALKGFDQRADFADVQGHLDQAQDELMKSVPNDFRSPEHLITTLPDREDLIKR